MRQSMIIMLVMVSITTLTAAGTVNVKDSVIHPEEYAECLEAVDEKITENEKGMNKSFNSPEHNFEVEPLPLIFSYYDHFPGKPTTNPMQIQPYPAGDYDGGGIYMAFMASQERRSAGPVHYARIFDGKVDELAVLEPPQYAIHKNSHRPDLDIDRETGNIVYTWTCSVESLVLLFAVNEYDKEGADLVSEAYPVLRNPYYIDNESVMLINPSIFIGPSPNEGQKRVYIFAESQTNFPGPLSGMEKEYIWITYADYDDIVDLLPYDPQQWSEEVLSLEEWVGEGVRT